MRVPRSAIRSVRPLDAHASGGGGCGCGCGGGHDRLVHIDFDPKATVSWKDLFERGMAEFDEAMKQRAAAAHHASPTMPIPTHSDHEAAAALHRLMTANAVAGDPALGGRAFTMTPAEAARFGIVPPVADGRFEMGSTASAQAAAAAPGGSTGYFGARMCRCVGNRYLCCDWVGFPMGFFCHWLNIRCGPLSQPGGGGVVIG